MESCPLEIWLNFLKFLPDKELLDKKRCSKSWKKNIEAELESRITWQKCSHVIYQFYRDLIVTWVKIKPSFSELFSKSNLTQHFFIKFSEKIGHKTIYFESQHESEIERDGLLFLFSHVIRKIMIEEWKSIYRFFPGRKLPYRYVDYSSLSPVKMYFDQKKKLKRIRCKMIENQFRFSILDIDVNQRGARNYIFRILERSIASLYGLKAETKIIFQFNLDFPLRYCYARGRIEFFDRHFLVHVVSRYSLAKFMEFQDNRFLLRHSLIDFIVFPF
jgi:hypothetical protein